MIKKVITILATFISTFTYFQESYALTLSGEERFVLDRFFRTLFLDSEGGYVYYNVKPICINGYRFSGQYYPGNENHKQMVTFQEGARVWKNLSPTINSNCLSYFYQVNDSLAKKYYHFLFINKKGFIETVQDEISLFKYSLGPTATPEVLLGQLLDPNIPFHVTLNDDKALIGVILGYGTKNSITVGRIESLQESFFAKELPPRKSVIQQLENLSEAMKEYLLLASVEGISNRKMFSPSFGFNSVDEELNTLIQRVEISSEKLSTKKPYFIFGKLTNDDFSNSRIELLEKVQEKILALTESSSFLPEVLSTMLQEEIDFANKEVTELSFSDNEINELSNIVATELWKLMQNEEEEFQRAFIVGMEDRNNSITTKTNRYRESFIEYEKCKIWMDVEKLHQCNIFFNNLEKNKECVMLIPNKLAYKVLKRGDGSSQIGKRSKALIHCTVFSGQDCIPVFDTSTKNIPLEIKISETIPGFFLATQGMSIGEIRELYIHPDYGYGVHTTFEKGQYLKINVELIDIISNSVDKEMNEIKPFNIDSLFPKNLEDLYKKYQHENGYIMGYQMWDHYKNCSHYSLPDIIRQLQIIKENPDNQLIKDIENSNLLLNRLHWNIYQNL